MTNWILDTDIGWDPDDVIALLLLLNYIKKNPKDNLAIVSSDEIPNGNRAKIIKYIVKNLMSNHNNILVCKGLNTRNRHVNISEELMCYRNEQVNTIDDLIDYIQTKKNICWIGIGAMTNLAYILSIQSAKQNINKIIQMAGCISNNIEYNVDLDRSACKYVLDNFNKPEKLEFISLDTTGYNLLWLNDGYCKLNEKIDINIYKYLAHYPVILEVLSKNVTTNISKTGYFSKSALHDPLTILFAIDNTIVNTHYARINFDCYNWKCRLNSELVKTNNNGIDNKFYNYWWKNAINSDIKSEPISKNFNCKISVGPLTEYQKNNFIQKLLSV